VKIRTATRNDLPRLVELVDQLSIEQSREDSAYDYLPAFEAIEADSRQTLFVAEDEQGGLVGTLVLIVVANLSHRGRPWAIIENVVVDEEHRGKGVGEQLVRHAVGLAREAGCYKVALASNKQRDDAHRFYRRLGFTATHEGFRVDL
jgi:GNAT superfamily N-acetyltransferase